MLICVCCVFGLKCRRNVLTIKQLQVVLVATTACCHWEKLGNILRTGFDNVQETKLSVKTERGGIGAYQVS